MNPFAKHIANALSISEHQVEATLKLLDEGCTIPFIARYRKERTGNLDEVQITRISELNAQLKELEKRKATILKTIAEQEKLTPELERRIRNCWNATELEDIYLPFKPRRRTRAQVAREQGLEPLATILLLQREANPAQAAKRFVKGDVADVEAALAGAKDIIAEGVSENEQARNTVRAAYRREAVISAKVVKKMAETDEAQKLPTTSTSPSRCAAAPPTDCWPCAAARRRACCASASPSPTKNPWRTACADSLSEATAPVKASWARPWRTPSDDS